MGLLNKGKKQKYYSLKGILSKHAQYNIIVGERSNGKTYACLKYGLECYVKDHSEMAYIRRTKEDFIGNRGVNLFAGLVANGEVEKITHGEYTDIYYYASRWYLCKYTEKGERVKCESPFCYGFAISTSEHDKSTSFPHVRNIIFDEFITRTYYLSDEFTLFQNLISTIIRLRSDVTIFMLGNTVNKYGCPYITEMGLKHLKNMKQGAIDVYKYGDSELTVAVEYCKPDEKGKPNNYYFAFDNPKLAMIKSGVWEMDIHPHLPVKYKPRHVLLHYFIEYSGELLHAEIVSINGMTFTFIHPKTTPLSEKEKTHNLIYSTEIKPQPNYHRRITEPCDKITNKVADYFSREQVYYSSNEVGEIMMNYIKWCRST